jgi:hypothetical protein
MENNNQTDLEEVIQEVEKETPQEVVEETTKVDLSKFESADEPDIIKVDLTKPPTDETKESDPDDTRVAGGDESPEPTQEQEEVQPQAEVQEQPVSVEQPKIELPENVEKLVNFINETGGDIRDYVNLNRNLEDIDDQDALLEYYKETKPHLTSEDINFLMEDQFSFDEDLEAEKDIKRKKLALKEQVAEAKAYLDGQKSKYYEDLKAGSKLTPEQQEAIEFYQKYNEESETSRVNADNLKSEFNKKTNEVFGDNFEGFEYNVGDKNFRYKVKDVDNVKTEQSNINNFVKKFLNDKNVMEDATGYHKGLYTANNADAIARHFYEQGKADAIQDTMANAKNINTNARGSHGEVKAGGITVRALGDTSADFKFKIKRKK